MKQNAAYVIAARNLWDEEAVNRFLSKFRGHKIYLIRSREKLTFKFLDMVKPRYVFFTHWSWKIPAPIYENFECVVFHMTDLPFGRGGTPLQNLIVRGISGTKISAFRAQEEIDAGPVYLKKSLSLAGSAREIFQRAAKVVYGDMIPCIIASIPLSRPQKGRAVVFTRRRPAMSNIARLHDLRRVYDYIRMLDADGYPPAFIETPRMKFEFSGGQLRKNQVNARVKITIKGKK